MLFAAKPMIPDSADYRVKWISITNKWKLIDEQVRIRRMEKNLSWLHEDVDSVLSSLCDHRRTPLDDFYATFSIGAGTGHVVRAMDQVSKLFLKLANSETDTIGTCSFRILRLPFGMALKNSTSLTLISLLSGSGLYG